MRDDGKDEYDIRKQEEVLQESYMMVPDSKARLEIAIEELKTAIAGCDSEADNAMITEVRKFIEETSTVA
jgi:hypothetical protein